MPTTVQPSHAEPLHPQIARFVRESLPEMSVYQAAAIVGISYDSMRRLCASGTIEAQELGVARSYTFTEAQQKWLKGNPGKTVPQHLASASAFEAMRRGHGKRWTITKAALITYLVRQTAGDKTLILDAIAEMCPRWLDVARKAAGKEGETRGLGDGETPANVIPMKRRVKSVPSFEPHTEFSFVEELTPAASA